MYFIIITNYTNLSLYLFTHRKMASGGKQSQKSERVAQVIRNLVTMKENSKSITGMYIVVYCVYSVYNVCNVCNIVYIVVYSCI